MSANVTNFNFQGNEVRIFNKNGNPMFVASDVAKVLGYSNPQKAVRDHCKGVNDSFIPSNGGNQLAKIIPESDVYRLVMRSNLPDAERFQDWVCNEVLPSIRKHGAYMTDEVLQKTLSDPDYMIGLLSSLKEEKQKRLAAEQENKDNAPMVLFSNAVKTSKTSILIGELAKILKQNGIEIGQNRLFDWLRNNGFLIRRKGVDYNMPTQKSMELGLFEIKETVINHSDGHISVSKTPKVTGRGQIYFVEKFLVKV